MPASLPGATLAQNQGNPSQGGTVLYDPLSGPKGSPLDRDQAGNCSTGALCTGIGFGARNIIGLTAPASITAAGFNDDYAPGSRGVTYGAQNTVLSRFMYIGGGRMVTNPVAADKFSVPFSPSEYTAGILIGLAGNGGSRDAGAGPAFTPFAAKMVTAAAGVAIGGVIETGFVNRSPRALVTGESVFGSATAATAAPS